VIKRSVPTIVIGGVGGCGLGELAGSRCVLLLEEQVGLAGPRVLEGAHCKCCSTE